MTLQKTGIALLMLALCFGAAIAQKDLPPAGGQPKDLVLPPRTTLTLDNGLRVTMVPFGRVPKLSVVVAIRAGKISEKPDQVWISDLVGDMMKEGTVTRPAKTLARDAARIGGSITVTVGNDGSQVNGSALSDFGTDLIALLADVVRNPAFPESELSRLKGNLIRRLSVAKSQPDQLASEKFRNVLYGDHPYGRRMPSEEALGAYTLDQVRAFYSANFVAARTHIYVSGMFDRTKVEAAIRKAFGDWPRGDEPVINVPEPVSSRAVYVVDRPGSSQSTIIIGLPVINPQSPDYLALVQTNLLLGGAFSSRITSNIRENKGYTYSPYSTISSRYRDAYWMEQADVSTDVTGAALKEILFEINRLQEVPPSPEELKGIQNYQAGIFVIQNATPRMILNLLMFADIHGLPEEYLKNYVKNIYAVTPAKVQSLTKEHLRDEEMTIVIVGDRKKIERQVAGFGKLKS
ncbi:MAG: peptidase [Bacteroidetes bacterium]|nr:peptidase [Bacteroidota bacterium]